MKQRANVLRVSPLFLALLAAACGGNPAGTAGANYDESVSQDLTTVCGARPSGAVQGYDVSVWQGDFAWGGVQFGAARVSDGTGYIDPKFEENWSNMKAKGIYRAAYQFFEPGEDAAAQARLVISKVGKLGNGDLPVMLDVEVTGGQSPATIRAKAQQWLQLVEQGTGKKPFVYSYGSFLETNLGAGFGSYPLWIANYGPQCPMVPNGWSNWTFWQYSDGSGKLDHDVFNGSLDQLKKFAGEAPPAGPATPHVPHYDGCGRIPDGYGLEPGEEVRSCDGRFTLAMQTDGNLVLYLEGVGALWATRTDGTDASAAIMQGDGNFVLYGKYSNAHWASRTDGHGGAFLAMQDDGNVVVYSDKGKALWASGTWMMGKPPSPSGCGQMEAGQGLVAGETFSTCDGRYFIAMQGDGNFVLYKNGHGALWATGTDRTTGYAAIMQGDGNLVVYDRHGRALWASHTAGEPGSHLAVQTDGNLVIYQGSRATWASHTTGR